MPSKVITAFSGNLSPIEIQLAHLVELQRVQNKMLYHLLKGMHPDRDIVRNENLPLDGNVERCYDGVADQWDIVGIFHK